MLVVLAAAAVVASIPLLWWSLATGRQDRAAIARNLSGGAVSDLRQLRLQRSPVERGLGPLVRWIAALAWRWSPPGWFDRRARRLALAGIGDRWTAEAVLAVKVLLAALGALVVVPWWLGAPGAGRLVLALLAAGGAYVVPDLIVRGRARRRQEAILLSLPDTLDQITIAVEAGLGFDAALARAGRSGSGPLAQELVRTLQEMNIGVPRTQALRSLIARTDVTDLRQFVFAVIQAETYGVPIARVLRIQSQELRVKRRQRAEERAMKIPVKVVFPLVLCILPSLFIIILGPAMIRTFRDLFGAGGL